MRRFAPGKSRRGRARAMLGGCLLLALLLAAGLAGADEEVSEYGNIFAWVTVGGVRVKAEVVKSQEKLWLGLGRRPSLPEGRGMLFVMPDLKIQTFCMRDMQFPIDIIWVAAGRVAGVARDLSPADQSACYYSPVAVNFVLEVPAGFGARHHILEGDRVSWEGAVELGIGAPKP